MIQVLLLFSAVYMIACGENVSDVRIESDMSAQNHMPALAETEVVTEYEDRSNQEEEDYEISYVVIADTGTDYGYLHKKMIELSRMLNNSIDTLGRFYDETKDLISLPEDDEDEMYAGTYFPRRFSSESLSLEYLRFYQESAGTKTIALVSGMYEKESRADSALLELSRIEQNAFKVKTTMYVGCMH